MLRVVAARWASIISLAKASITSASRIASLSSGEFVGVVADNPEEKISLKTFCSEIINDHDALKRQAASFKEPPKISAAKEEDILENFLQVKKEVSDIIE